MTAYSPQRPATGATQRLDPYDLEPYAPDVARYSDLPDYRPTPIHYGPILPLILGLLGLLLVWSLSHPGQSLNGSAAPAQPSIVINEAPRTCIGYCPGSW